MKNNKTRILFLTLLSIFIIAPLNAATMYVTDRIMLGVHQDPEPSSPLITSVPTGTVVESGETSGAFTKVTLQDGNEGWVNTGYLRKDKPAAAEFDALYKQYEKTVVTLKEVNAQLTKKERDWQLWRDEAINQRNAIKALKKKMAKGEKLEVDPEAAAKLKTAEDQNAKLTEQVASMQIELEQLKQINQSDTVKQLQEYQANNIMMKTRIEAALANLEGRTVPTPEELASIRPDFPIWYTILLVLMIIIGIGAGVGYMDYQNRRRHGGFRL